MKWLIGLFACACLTFASACSKDEGSKEPPKAGTPTAPDTPTDVAADEIPDEDLPVMTDFEEEAEKQITADNLMKELEALEGEITADGE